MRQFNFVIIFILCLGFGLFTIENTKLVTIYLVPGLQVEAPMAVLLLLTFGIGALFAWLFSIWTRLQRLLLYTQKTRRQTAQIKDLESKVSHYQAEIQSLQLALPPSNDNAQAMAQ